MGCGQLDDTLYRLVDDDKAKRWKAVQGIEKRGKSWREDEKWRQSGGTVEGKEREKGTDCLTD